jgi:hypothetical protein
MSGTWTTEKTMGAEPGVSADWNAYVRDNGNYLKTHIDLEAAVAITIAAGIVTLGNSSNNKVAGEGAADDDLDTIAGGAEGMVVFLWADGNNITLKHGTGNLDLGQDILLLDGDVIALMSDGTSFKPIDGGRLKKQASGAETGTGSEQTIAHGLPFTPTAAQISLTSGSATANPYHSTPPDATNIYVTAITGQAWYWATAGI